MNLVVSFIQGLKYDADDIGIGYDNYPKFHPEARLEEAREKVRKDYFAEHGRWPEEDGIEIYVVI